ncbi:MAG TPA: UTRA domain-containing protein, partial [Cyclobacteriaceae bacterium]|nr:UTRA domain-containing protein [Cyclobacteriaceae bacterium]
NKLTTLILSKPVLQNWPQPFLFELSNAEKESGCIFMERLRIVDNIPIMYDVNYLPNINLPRFTSRRFENRSLFDMLRRNYGIEVTGGEQKIWAMRAEGKVAGYLQVSEGDPVVHMQRMLMTNRPGYKFYSSLYCSTERYFLFGSF